MRLLAILICLPLAAYADDSFTDSLKNVVHSTGQGIENVTNKVEDAFTNVNTSVYDANITTQINTKLADNYYKNLQVETKQGVVKISGTVAEQNDIDKIKNLAINVTGVKQVNLDLKVKSQTSE